MELLLSEFSEMSEEDEYFFLIDGNWVRSESKETIPIKNPYNDEIIGRIQSCSKKEVDRIIEVANNGVQCWKETPLRKRAACLHKAAELILKYSKPLSEILMKEIGKPIKGALSEIVRTADLFHATAEAGVQLAAGESSVGDASRGFTKNKLSMSYRVPLGTILCIGPFNYPFNLTGSKIAPALMAGNSIVMKPPTEGAITALHFGVILEKAGVPPGVFNIVTGRGSVIGDYLVKHTGIHMVAFTGSSSTGKHIAEVAGMKPLLMELGGKDAAIIIEDADVDITIKAIISGAFSYSGQRCTAVKRILPLPGIADLIVERVTEEAKKLSVGNPAEDKTIGPLISSKQSDYVQELIDDALEKGAVLKCGNKRQGNIIWPTVLDNVTTNMRVAWEEPFGPVLPIIRVNDVEEAIDISNESEYGLQGMIFTENIDLAFNIAQELNVGTVQLNGKSSRGPDHFPFLGAKSSGLGTQGIKYSIEAMSRPKVIVMNLSERGKLIRECKT